MTKLPGARPSPRIAGGVLRWYAGDTFSVTLALELRDQDGDPVTVGASDSLTVSFFDASHAPVQTSLAICLLRVSTAAFWISTTFRSITCRQTTLRRGFYRRIISSWAAIWRYTMR